MQNDLLLYFFAMKPTLPTCEGDMQLELQCLFFPYDKLLQDILFDIVLLIY